MRLCIDDICACKACEGYVRNRHRVNHGIGHVRKRAIGAIVWGIRRYGVNIMVRRRVSLRTVFLTFGRPA